jgi:ubiquitin-protein ligase
MASKKDGGVLSVVAIRKLARELNQLEQNPIPGVGVDIDDDLRAMFVNFEYREGTYAGAILHLHLTFGSDYPSKPPAVRLLTKHAHSHVFNDKICFSLIEDFKWHFESTNSPSTVYWTPAVDMRRFLESLYFFLMEDDAGQEAPEPELPTQTLLESQICQFVEQSKIFKCDCCSHTGQKPYPKVHFLLFLEISKTFS